MEERFVPENMAHGTIAFQSKSIVAPGWRMAQLPQVDCPGLN
jgi:hypothetical protein